MTMIASRPFDGLNWAKVPDRIADREDCAPRRVAVARAIFRCAGCRGFCTETREQLANQAKVTLAEVSRVISWLVRIGELELVKDRAFVSRRRMVLIGRDDPEMRSESLRIKAWARIYEQ